jgi:hypothetical protein
MLQGAKFLSFKTNKEYSWHTMLNRISISQKTDNHNKIVTNIKTSQLENVANMQELYLSFMFQIISPISPLIL